MLFRSCCVAAPFGLLNSSSTGNGSGSRDLLECLSYLAWAANPLAWIGYGGLAGGRLRKARGFGVCALILALLFGGIALSRDSVHWTLGPGYWLWVASMAFLVIGAYICKDECPPRWLPSDEYLREACRYLEFADEMSRSEDDRIRPARQHEHVRRGACE